jgi:transposase
MRKDATYETLCEAEPEPNTRQRSDKLIQLGAERRTMRNPLRRIELEPLEGHEELVLLTNHIELDAETLAQLYGERWQIEQFFRLLKQNLRVKTFVGTSANAVLIQIWTALIAILLLKYLKLRAKFAWSFANLLAMLRLQPFVYRDLQQWLDQPFRAPPTPVGLSYEQLGLPFSSP